MFDEHVTQWKLTPDGDPIMTRSSRLLPVRWKGIPAMLKVASEVEEKSGGSLMAWWDGEGAAKVLAQKDDAILLERAEGAGSLTELATTGRDDEAIEIICAVVAKLHAPRAKAFPQLAPLSRWFRDLEPAAATHGGPLALSADAARAAGGPPRAPRAAR
jgi:streptomycin 6-kinase